MRKNQIKLRLQINVTYNTNSILITKKLKQGLIWAAEHLAGEGLLSGDTEASVELWEPTVVELHDAANTVNKVL
jgi:hypothetical protein